MQLSLSRDFKINKINVISGLTRVYMNSNLPLITIAVIEKGEAVTGSVRALILRNNTNP